MIFKTYVFSLYSHLCINKSMYLYSYQIYPQYIWTGCRLCLRAIQGAPEDDDGANSEMHLEAVIKQVWSCTWRPRWSELRDVPGGRNWACLGMHLETITSAQCKSVWKPYANLPDTPVALTSASKYFQMLPAPPGALGSALRLCKSIHQQNVIWSGSYTQSSQTLRATSPVLLCTSRCSQTPLELSKVLSDSARAFSGAPESTCSYGGEFRMLRDLTYRIVKFWSSWDLCADLRETSRDAAQHCRIHREQPGPQRSTAGDLVPYSHSSGSYITTKHFVLSYLSLLQSEDSLHHHMACMI